MSASQNHGGKRQGAGRPRGSLNKRSIEAIETVAARFPNWTPLLHFAAVANDKALPPDIRLDAAKAAAPFIHPRPKHIELDAEAAVELEGRIAEARVKAVKEGINLLAGFGERLARAKARAAECENENWERAVALAKEQLIAEQARAPEITGKPAPSDDGEAALKEATAAAQRYLDAEKSFARPAAEPKPIAQPSSPKPDTTHAPGDWQYRHIFPPFPEQPVFAQADYDPTEHK